MVNFENHAKFTFPRVRQKSGLKRAIPARVVWESLRQSEIPSVQPTSLLGPSVIIQADRAPATVVPNHLTNRFVAVIFIEPVYLHMSHSTLFGAFLLMVACCQCGRNSRKKKSFSGLFTI